MAPNIRGFVVKVSVFGWTQAVVVKSHLLKANDSHFRSRNVSVSMLNVVLEPLDSISLGNGTKTKNVQSI